MQDIVRSLVSMENTLLDISGKIEALRNQVQHLTDDVKQKSHLSSTQSQPVQAGQQGLRRPQRKTPYGTPYRPDARESGIAVSSTQEGIQETWVVGDGGGPQAMYMATSTEEYKPGLQASARQSEYSIYARP